MPRGVAALALVLAGGFALAQTDRYEQQYGDPVDISLDDLVSGPEAYLGRAVRTRGNLEMASGAGSRAFQLVLRSTMRREVWIVPIPEVEFEWDQQSRQWLGKEVEVTGLFSRTTTVETGEIFQIRFWGYVGPPEDTKGKGPLAAASVSLEKLVERPGKYAGQNVRVVGKFRGRNLYGDLPTRSQRSRSDWVIKDDLFAIWVTGRKPKGEGWELDPTLRRDTGKWILVAGRAETAGGVVYVKAVEVSLTTAPTPTAEAKPPPPPPEKPKLPPVVVFALPLDGEREVSPDSKFRVQFSKDMDEASFPGHVVLRYAPPRQPGDRALDDVQLSYDGGRRALTVDPGDVLRAGRVVELILLPGILDTDGLGLEGRPGKMGGEAVDVLRFRVAAGLLLANP